VRGSATSLTIPDASQDAVITDPPYYDNISYADLSDFFYVWLKRSVGFLYPDDFGGELTPKRSEAVSVIHRHAGNRKIATEFYESMMAAAFAEAYRVLKPGALLVCIYAHKTTLGWATLVDALRKTGFVVSEAWPMDTETLGRLRAQDSAALASSIFLVARKREGAETGNYEEAVKPELEQIVRERVATLWAMGISGADLVIACVGAGLRAFTRFARVEYANGEEVPAERFLTEVETVVLETILDRLSKEVGGKSGQTSLAGMDAPTRFYVLWRYTYGAADLDAGEAIIFANGTHVELDGHNGLASGSNAVLEKKKSKYRLRDFTERGDDDDLGVPDDAGTTRPVVDVLHRLLWLLEHKPPKIPEFLADAQPSLEELRLVCQALSGPALKGGELEDVSAGAEQSALGKLLANWSAVIEGQQVKADKVKGQERLL
jgi:putative DNA methylase